MLFQTIRVLLVDDCKLTSTAVRAVISEVADIVLLDETATLTTLQKFCAPNNEPDILLLSLDLVSKTQSTLTGFLRCYPLAKTVLIATDCTNVCVSEFSENNIWGCILREQIPDELIPAIRGTMVGISCYSQSVVQQFSQWPNGQVVGDKVENLTPREREVLSLLTAGLTNRQISLQLKVSESTVEFHVGNLYKKLKVTSRVEAAVRAKAHRLI